MHEKTLEWVYFIIFSWGIQISNLKDHKKQPSHFFSIFVLDNTF